MPRKAPGTIRIRICGSALFEQLFGRGTRPYYSPMNTIFVVKNLRGDIVIR